jgi:hypothetical protein
VEDIAETIFGPLVVERFEKIVGYVEKIRKYIPPKKKEEKTVKQPRKRGTDIVFAKEKMYAPFHIMKIYVTGEENASMEAKDLTTTPWVVGRPATADAAYKNFKLGAAIDRSRDIPAETFNGNADDYIMAGAVGDVDMKANFKGEDVSGKLKWEGRGLLPAEWLNYLNLQDPLINIAVIVYGKKDALKYSMKSNLDQIISAQLKKEIDKKIKEAKAEVNALLDKEILGNKSQLQSQISGFKDEQTDFLNKEKLKLQAKVDELNNLIEQKKREQEEQIDRKKKEAEEELKKRAEEEFKKIFK